jgi:hypothetical protein
MNTFDVPSYRALFRCRKITLGTLVVSDLVMHCLNVPYKIPLDTCGIVTLGTLDALGRRARKLKGKKRIRKINRSAI